MPDRLSQPDMSGTLSLLLSKQSEAARLLTEGDHTKAKDLCRQALAILTREKLPASPRLAFLWLGLGSALEQTGDYSEAETCATASLETIQALLPDKGGKSGELIRLRALGLLITALRQQGLYAKAEPFAVRLTELAAALPDHPSESATAWNHLGMLCKYAGWFTLGADAYAKSLAFAELQTKDREGTIATILHNIGGLAHARGHFAEGEEPARRAWEIRRELLGDEHLLTLSDATAYAAVLDGLKRYRESRPIYENALAIYEGRLGPDHYEVAATLHNLALLENAEGNRERAVQLARRSFRLKRNLLGADHPDTALSAMNLASLLPAEAKLECGELLETALRTFTRSLGTDHPHTLRCRQLIKRGTQHHLSGLDVGFS